MDLMTPAWTDNSIVARWRHAHQSGVYVASPSDDTSVITRAHAAYDFLRDKAIKVKKNIVHGASMTKNEHCE